MFHVCDVSRHVPDPASEYWYVTAARPEPPGSSAVAASAIARRRFVPGFAIETAGGVLSIRMPVTGTPSVSLPATSTATVRKS